MAYLIINSMEGKYQVSRPSEEFLPLTADIFLTKDKFIPIEFVIPPNNVMEGIVDVFARPTIKKKLSVIRDAYVSEKVPTYNYGNRSQIRVGVDTDGTRFRSFLLFDLSSLEEKLTIISAKLHFNVANPEYTLDHMEISTSNKTFDEYGITWDNQPSRQKLIDVFEIEKNKEALSFTITDVVKEWYQDSRTNNGILLKEFGTSKGSQITLHSKEGGYPPYLEIEYFDPNFGVPRHNSLPMEMTVQKGDEKSIPLEFNVITYKKDEPLPLEMFVKSIRGELWIEGYISVTTLPLHANIKKVQDKPLPLEFIVSFSDESPIPIEFNVTQNSLPIHLNIRAINELVFESRVTVNSIPLQMFISQRSLDVSFHVRGFNEIGLSAQISKQDIPIEFNVAKANYIGISGNIIKRLNDTRDIEFTVGRREIPLEFYLRQGHSIPVELSILARREKTIGLTLNVYKSNSSTRPLEFNTKAISDLLFEMEVNSKYLDLSMVVLRKKEAFRNIELNVRSFEAIPLEFIVTKFKDLPLFMEVQKIWFDDIEIRMIIGRLDKKRSYVFIM